MGIFDVIPGNFATEATDHELLLHGLSRYTGGVPGSSPSLGEIKGPDGRIS